MNEAHLHLILTHLPVLGVPFGIALLVASLRRLDPTLQRAGLIVLLLAGVGAGLAYLTGEPAEEALESLAIRPGETIEAHEEAALFGLLATGALALAALLGWWRARRSPLGRSTLTALILAGVLVTGSLAWVANLGGQIRHPEVSNLISGSREAEEEH